MWFIQPLNCLLLFLSLSTGDCLWHCTIPRLLFLLHNPTGTALPVLFCWPASRGENRPGKGRQRRMYPTSAEKHPLLLSTQERKCSNSYLVVFNFCCEDTFPLLEEMMWFTTQLPLTLSPHCFMPKTDMWMSVCVLTMYSCIPPTRLTYISPDNITNAAFRVCAQTTAQELHNTGFTNTSIIRLKIARWFRAADRWMKMMLSSIKPLIT